MKTKQEILREWKEKTKEPYLWGVQAKVIYIRIKNNSVERAIELLKQDYDKYKEMSCSGYTMQAINDLEELKQPIMP